MSQTTEQEFARWLTAPAEDEHIEFKEAKRHFDFEKLVKYCCALANEGGGRLVLGVTDKPPRRVVGSQAFADWQRTKAGVIERLHLRIEIETLAVSGQSVRIFHVPSRPPGIAIPYEGAYWMRRGEELVPMLPDMLRRIFAETGPDFSAEVCSRATLADLAPEAIAEFRRRWQVKSGNAAMAGAEDARLLNDAGLLDGDRVTYAALVLLGQPKALARHLANAEVVFEYRSAESNIEYQQREEFRTGFLLFHDRLWQLINLRNDLQHFRDGLFLLDIPTFNEDVVREAVLNAVCHRDYRHQGSVFVRQYPRQVVIESPGGLPAGITVDNLLYRQSPRNRLVAEALAKAGLVERAGQGFDKMFSSCCREAKPLPTFAGTDEYWVFLLLDGNVQDQAFLRFLEQLGDETQRSFTVEDFLVLHYLREGRPVPQHLAPRLPRLLEAGAIERSGRRQFLLAKRFYAMTKTPGHYTSRRGLDRETNKELIVKHLKHFGKGTLLEFQQALPALSRYQMYSLLNELRREGRVSVVGRTKAAYWVLSDRIV